MRVENLNFGVILRVLLSLLPILLGLPTVAIIMCAYNLAMSFIVFGPLTALVSSLCAICFSMLFGGSFGAEAELSGLVWAIQAIFCAAGCLYGIPYRKNFYNGLCFATLGMLVPQFIHISYTANKAGLTVAEALVPPVDSVKLMMKDVFSQVAGTIEPSLIEKLAETVHGVTTMLIPSTLIITSMVLAYIVVWAVSKPLRKLPFGMIHSFSHIKVSGVTTIISIVFIVLTIAFTKFPSKLWLMVSCNTLTVLLTMSFFAGASLVDFYMRRFIPLTVIRVIIHGIIAFNIFPVYIIAAFVDSFANFRKLPIAYKKDGEACEAEE